MDGSTNWQNIQNYSFGDPKQINLANIENGTKLNGGFQLQQVIKQEVHSPENHPKWHISKTLYDELKPIKIEPGETAAKRKLDLARNNIVPTTSSNVIIDGSFSIHDPYAGLEIDPLQLLRSVQENKLQPKNRGKRKAQKDDCDGSEDIKGSSRLDNSLLMTTRKFLALRDENDILNLNEAANCLRVPKRRLYDITNVLEGIDLVEKVGKNSIRWKTPECDEHELMTLHRETQDAIERERQLDLLIDDVQACLKLVKDDPIDRPYSYVKFSDLRSIRDIEDQTLIAVKASADSFSSIEVADPVSTGKFQIVIKNEQKAPLTAFLCPPVNASVADEIEVNVTATGDGLRHTSDLSDAAVNQPCSSKTLHEQYGLLQSDIVLPPRRMTENFENQISSPSRFSGGFMSPLKMLAAPITNWTPNAPTLDQLEANLPLDTFLPLEPGTGQEAYGFPFTSAGLSDLFTGSDWDLI